MNRDDILKGTKELSERTGLSVSFWEKRMQDKRLPFIKAGDRVLFFWGDVHDYLSKNRKPIIRDSVKTILKIIPPDAPKRNFRLCRDCDQDFLYYSNLITERLGSWRRELLCADWLEVDLVKQAKIIYENLEAIHELCILDIPDLKVSLIERLFQREAALWQDEIVPKLKLAEKFFNVGKLQNVELRTLKAGTTHNVHISGETYIITDSWSPIPLHSEADAIDLFNRRYVLNIRLALRTRKPISFREQQALIEQQKVDCIENIASLESDYFEGDK